MIRKDLERGEAIPVKTQDDLPFSMPDFLYQLFVGRMNL